MDNTAEAPTAGCDTNFAANPANSVGAIPEVVNDWMEEKEKEGEAITPLLEQEGCRAATGW